MLTNVLIHLFVVYKELNQQLESIKQGGQSHSVTHTDLSGHDLFLSDDSSDPHSRPIKELVNTCKQSLEGQIKDLVQGELIKTLHHRETEDSLRRQSEDLEDYFEQSQREIRKHLGKIQEIEREYRDEDALHYKEIHNKVWYSTAYNIYRDIFTSGYFSEK